MYYGDNYEFLDFDALRGKTLVSILVAEDESEITFVTSDGQTYKLFHDQNCCENVRVEDISGNLAELVFQPVLLAEEVSGETGESEYGAHYTWTFYKLATNRGAVTIRWYGESNGYYSENVSFARVKD